MTVTALCIVLGMAVMTIGIHTMLNEQIRQAGDMQQIGLGKLQAYYLAEMGLNQIMFVANQDPDADSPFPVTKTANQATVFDFKSNVESTRSFTGGVAKCTITYQSGNATNANFLVAAHLVTQGGSFDRTIQFSAQKMNGAGQPWVLAGYSVIQ